MFEALKKEGLKWDNNTKKIVIIKKYKFIPFDKVVVRDNGVFQTPWKISLFERQSDNEKSICIDGNWDECLPYNEETAKLIGTTNDYKE